MRHRSIAGPVILILLGFLFLLDNLRPDFSFWHNIWHYWPFILIVFGVLRLAEVLVVASQGGLAGAAPNVLAGRRRSSRGGFGLIIVLCVIFWAVAHNRNPSIHIGNWVHNDSLDLFGDQFDYPISNHGSAAGVNLVRLDSVRGNITVTGGDGDEYSAEGHKTVRSYNRNEADEANRRSEVKFVREGNQLILRVDESQVSSNRKISTDLDIKVPRGVAIEARGRSGDVTLSSIAGTVDISSDHGDIRLNDVAGDAKLSIAHSGLIRVVDAKGNVDLDGRGSDVQMENVDGPVTVNGSYSGTLEFKNLAKPFHFQSPQTDMRLERLPGSLTLDLSDLHVKGVQGPMRLHTKSRDVHIEDFSDSMEIDIADRGDIELTTAKSPVGKIDAHTRNGNIDLGLPDGAAFDLRVNTARGEAQNEYGPAVKLEIDGHAASLKSVDGRGAAVIGNTDRGSVSVRKSSAARD